MQKIQFSCTLLSDIILSESASTESKHGSLDFIPGGNFLGVVASSLYKAENENTRLLFHSGSVRFGDAHPAYRRSDGTLIRSLRIPAVYFTPKLKNLFDGEAYLSHTIPNPEMEILLEKQLKQCRDGFYAFDKDTAYQVNVEKNFSLKSSYDSERRRSKDGGLFAYESIASGREFLFDVELDDEATALKEDLIASLCGTCHIGRSRSAQYGWVRIEQAKYLEVEENQNATFTTVYADGRLVFFDENGLPTFRPRAKDLGFDSQGAEIDWTKSQVRICRYSPWNFKRQSFDNERCVIEKGSTFIIKNPGRIPTGTHYIGAYCNEGFGRIVVNPYFLDATEDGKCRVHFIEESQKSKANKPNDTASGSTLLSYLRAKESSNDAEKTIYSRVDEFSIKNKSYFRGVSASQWGTIRGLAIAAISPDKILPQIEQYLDHGVAKAQWEEHDGAAKLTEELKTIPQSQLREYVVNLASKMAKICKNQ